MAWTTPTLTEVRRLVRDHVTAGLRAAALIPNSVLRVIADAKAMLAHLVLLYIDWLAKQLLPDTAETEWLDRHGRIWLKNADGSQGRKAATYASGTAAMTGEAGTVVPLATPLRSAAAIAYETTAEVTLGEGATNVPIVALDPGSAGNLDAGETIALTEVVSGADTKVTVVSLAGGADEENDDDLRERVLFRIQEPPMGGSGADYVRWAKAVPGVTRAWASPNEMGVGTMVVRFMMDELRAGNDGFPLAGDIAAVRAYLDTVRPVTLRDHWVVAPIPQPYDVAIGGLDRDDAATRAAVIVAIKTMERGKDNRSGRAKPGQTMYRAWVDEAVSAAAGEDHHELIFTSAVMPSPGHMPVLGTVTFPP